MRVYCMSDIHGCLAEFCDALELVLPHLGESDTMLVLLGDYIHGGTDNRGVLDKIISLQERYGSDKVVALLGNHDEWVMNGSEAIDYTAKAFSQYDDYDYEDAECDDDRYIQWFEMLPRYYVAGNTIFVHAGIDESAGDMWEWSTSDDVFTSKYPAETGKIDGLDMKVVAGHVGTAEIAGDPRFHDIYFDGESHYYIDGTVLDSGVIPVLLVDTEEDEYYQVTEAGEWLIAPYGGDD
ncbi:MAG: metallophosphoesterase [Oscillospiraceae bacterium]